MNKQTIIHVIDGLGRGGAETMLIGLLKHMSVVYNVVLVTLSDESDFSSDDVCCANRYSLGFSSIKNLPSAVWKLKKIIKAHRTALVRSQLYWSTVICRLAVPKDIPFVFSIHSQLSKDAFEVNRYALPLERATYRSRHAVISVSQAAFDDYSAHINVKGRHFILNNFVQDKFFSQGYDFGQNSLSVIKLIAVGNLKEAKNYFFLLNVIKEIKDKTLVQLDIVGDGHLRQPLQQFIDEHSLPVRLLGKRSDVETLLPHYDAFVMCSVHEGFGNAPVEAMAVGLPLILNDLDVMKEMSRGNALFYKSGDVAGLAALISDMPNKKDQLLKLSQTGKINAAQFYSSRSYFEKLKAIYEGITAAS